MFIRRDLINEHQNTGRVKAIVESAVKGGKHPTVRLQTFNIEVNITKMVFDNITF